MGMLGIAGPVVNGRAEKAMGTLCWAARDLGALSEAMGSSGTTSYGCVLGNAEMGEWALSRTRGLWTELRTGVCTVRWNGAPGIQRGFVAFRLSFAQACARWHWKECRTPKQVRYYAQVWARQRGSGRGARKWGLVTTRSCNWAPTRAPREISSTKMFKLIHVGNLNIYTKITKLRSTNKH